MNKKEKMIKIAFNITELNDPINAGYSISQAIKFLIRNIPFDKRYYILLKIKQKILQMNEKEIASKNIPTTAILGQTISLIKNLLHGNDSRLIKDILLNIYKNL